MDFNDYQKNANRTLMGDEQVLTNCILGLASETGDVVDIAQQYTFKGQRLNREQLTKKMGDVLWYLSQVSQWADIPFDDVAKRNIDRLNKKYPKKMSLKNKK